MTMSRLEAVLASIGEKADASQRKLDQAAEFASRSEHLQVEGRSADEMARVSVDGTGQVVAITLDDDVRRLDPAAIAADVMEAMRQAQRRLSHRVEQLGTEIYGEDSPAVASFSQAYRDKFGYEEDDR